MGDVLEFTTDYHNQMRYVKATSSCMNFAFKSNCPDENIGDVAITLADLPSRIPEIHFYKSECCLMNKNMVRIVSYKEDNIFPTKEFKGFWISWNNSTIKIGRQGCFDQPIINYKTVKMTGIRNIAFAVYTAGMSVQWKVECPPVIKIEIPKPISGGKLKWMPMTSESKVLPDDTLVGGYQKEILHIARAKHMGSLTPGKYVPSKGYMLLAWGGMSHAKKVFDILCGYDCTWVPSHDDIVPLGAVVAGYSEDFSNESLYVGRAFHKGHLIPGKVQPSHGVCYIPYNGREIPMRKFEVLVVPPKHNAVHVYDEDSFRIEDCLAGREPDTLL